MSFSYIKCDDPSAALYTTQFRNGCSDTLSIMEKRYRIVQRHQATIESKIEAIRSGVEENRFQKEITVICELRTFLRRAEKPDCHQVVALQEEVDREKEWISFYQQSTEANDLWAWPKKELNAMVRKTEEYLQKIGLGSLIILWFWPPPPMLYEYKKLHNDLKCLLSFVLKADQSKKKVAYEDLDNELNRYKELHQQDVQLHLQLLPKKLAFFEEGQQIFAELGLCMREVNHYRERQLLLNANNWSDKQDFYIAANAPLWLDTDISYWLFKECEDIRCPTWPMQIPCRSIDKNH